MGNYRADDLARVEAALSDHQTLTFVRPQDVANRPHMRFDGRTLSEIGDQRWRTCKTTRLDTSCVFVNAGRERRVEARHERRLGAHTSRASAWRPLLLSSPLRVSGGFDDGDRGVISSKSPSARRWWSWVIRSRSSSTSETHSSSPSLASHRLGVMSNTPATAASAGFQVSFHPLHLFHVLRQIPW